jgi:hypothetical protein
MAASKNLFNKERERMILDERETGNYPPFDHHENFCKKVKENWLSNHQFGKIKQSTDLMVLTNCLINYKMDVDYYNILVKIIDDIEPKYLKSAEYLHKIYKTPLENMERVYKKYDNIDNFIKSDWRYDLKTEIMKKQRLNK